MTQNEERKLVETDGSLNLPIDEHKFLDRIMIHITDMCQQGQDPRITIQTLNDATGFWLQNKDMADAQQAEYKKRLN